MLMPSTCTARLMRAYTSTLYTPQVSHKTQLPCHVLELKCGGLLFDRHKTPLTWRFVVYYCSAVYTYGLVKYEDRTIRVEYTPSLRASLLALLDEMRTAMRRGECHINHNQPTKCRSCGFRSVCGEGLI